jgi:hypothetical protein
MELCAAVPQGLKPEIFLLISGMAEAMPFQNRFMEQLLNYDQVHKTAIPLPEDARRAHHRAPNGGTEGKSCMHHAARTEETLKLNIVAQGGSWLNFHRIVTIFFHRCDTRGREKLS